MHPRKLQFVVGTSLLGMTLVGAAGCKQPTVNTRPEEPEPPHVNPGPEPVAPIEGEGEQPETPPPDTVEQPPETEFVTNQGPMRSQP